MKRLILSISILASVVSFVAPVHAYSSPGSPGGYVNDFAGVLSLETKQKLENELSSFQKTTSNEIAVAIVPNMGGDYIENYAVKLFEEWGIGGGSNDNGILLVLSVEERKMRIEVGYGLEGALPDSIAQSILNNEMTPLLKAGDYDSAIINGVRAIEQATEGEYAAPSQNNSSFFPEIGMEFIIFVLFVLQFIVAVFARSKSWWAGGVVGFIGGLIASWFMSLSLLLAIPFTILLIGLGLLFDYLVSSVYHKAKLSGNIPPWWIGGGGFGGGGHSGGGFGGFGGGHSGGGGASGSW